MNGKFLKISQKLGGFIVISSLTASFLFSVLPVSAQTAQAVISLTARNLNQSGPSYWSKSITAFPQDRIEFQIQIRSTGISPLYNARVSASLSWGLRYVLG